MPNTNYRKFKRAYQTVPLAPLHPKINPDDLIEGRIFAATDLKLIEEKLQDEKGNFRYSQRYLEEKGIHLNRGGILKINNQIYAVYKLPSTETDAAKAVVLGEGGYGKIKI